MHSQDVLNHYGKTEVNVGNCFIIHLAGGGHCPLFRDSEPIRLLEIPMLSSLYKLIIIIIIFIVIIVIIIDIVIIRCGNVLLRKVKQLYSILRKPVGGGRGEESAGADFNFQELPFYLSNNTYKILPLLLNFIIGERPDFRRHV